MNDEKKETVIDVFEDVKSDVNDKTDSDNQKDLTEIIDAEEFVESQVANESEIVPESTEPIEVDSTEEITNEINNSVDEELTISKLEKEFQDLSNDIIRLEKTFDNILINERKSILTPVIDLADNLDRTIASAQTAEVTPFTIRESIEIIIGSVSDVIECDFKELNDINLPEIVKPIIPSPLPSDANELLLLNDELRKYQLSLNNTMPILSISDKINVRNLLLEYSDKLSEIYNSLNPDNMPETANLIESISLVYNSLLKDLESKYHVTPMNKTVGETFNPRLHNGYGVTECDDISKNNTIVNEISSGYFMNDSIYRKPMVLVYKYQPKEEGK